MSTESFEHALSHAQPLCMISQKCNHEIADCPACHKSMVDRLRRAHDREIRDTAQQQYDRGFRDGKQQQYHRGFEDGRRSMDAEHRAIATRLRALPLDGGSHENLSQIARAIWHSDFGWTQDACMWLRDELVRLMGGVSNDTCGTGCCCAAADSDGRDSWEQAEVSDGRVADDSGGDTGGSYRGVSVHMDGLTAYDVLDNERRKAIAELRKVCTELDESVWTWIEDVAIAIGAQDEPNDEYESMLPKITDRLIHLLGGDQPSGIDVLRAMDAESDEDGTCPNDDITSSITDELRRFTLTPAMTQRVAPDEQMTARRELQAIADRIDAQFDRICQQHEDVLQSTIAELVEQCDEVRQECADMLDLLRDARDEYVRLRTENQIMLEDMRRRQAMLDESEHERDEARAKLDAIRGVLDGEP